MMDCINTHDQLIHARASGLPHVAVSPRRCPSSSRSRPHFQSGWEVWAIQEDLHEPGKTRSWYDSGQTRIFEEHSSTRDATLLRAKEWAAFKFGVKGWKRNRMHDWVDARVAKQFPLRKP